jgi:hypothetical protein
VGESELRIRAARANQLLSGIPLCDAVSSEIPLVWLPSFICDFSALSSPAPKERAAIAHGHSPGHPSPKTKRSSERARSIPVFTLPSHRYFNQPLLCITAHNRNCALHLNARRSLSITNFWPRAHFASEVLTPIWLTAKS